MFSEVRPLAVEIDTEKEHAYVYGMKHMNAPLPFEYELERSETVDGMAVHTLLVRNVPNPEKTKNLRDIGRISCFHGKQIDYKTSNRLPHPDWHDLLDYWSCHDGEFRTLLELQTKPRVGGILLGDFHIVVHHDLLPPCCQSTPLLFYNELSEKMFDDDFIIYNFFREYFMSKNKFCFTLKGRWYELKFFYACTYFRTSYRPALKVGIKPINGGENPACLLNEFYYHRIMENIESNSIGISLMGYTLSFILG